MYHCYFDGRVVPYGDCHLHISDLLIQRGYGVFEFFRIRGEKIPWLKDYMGRLFRSMQLAGLDSMRSRDEMIAVIRNLQQKNSSGSSRGNSPAGESAFKVLVTGGRSENLAQATEASSMIILQVPWNRPAPETYRDGVNLVSDTYLRPHPEIKTLFYFNNLRLRRKMKEYGAIDVLYHQGQVTETSRASVFFVQDGRVCTPGKNILDGITRKQVLGLFPGFTKADITLEEVYEMNEVFITSTSRDITPVVSIDGRKIGKGTPGPVTREVQEAFRSRGW